MSNAPEPSAADIHAFLESKAPDLAKGVDLPSLPNTPTTEAPKPTPAAEKLPTDPAFAPQQPTEDRAMDVLLSGEPVEFSGADMLPTEAEKEVFLTSVLVDEPVQLDLTLPGLPSVVITIRTRTNAQRALIFSTLEADRNSGRVANTMGYVSQLQYYDAAIRLVRFHKTDFRPEQMAETSEALRERADRLFANMSTLKWRVISSALRLFDLKLNATMNAVITRDFSKPAG